MMKCSWSIKVNKMTPTQWPGASLVAYLVKNLLAMQEIQVQSLSWEDLLEKEMATHFSNLLWEIPWTEKPGRLQSMGLQRVRHDWVTIIHGDPEPH